MDDKLLKKERKYNLLKCSVSIQKALERDLHVADFRYHLDCCLGVTVKYRPAGPVQSCAIVTTITTIMV